MKLNPWELPQAAEIGGLRYTLHTDYREILLILSYLNNPDMPDEDKIISALAVFYDEFDRMPEKDYQAAVDYLMLFINQGQMEEDSGRPPIKRIDWEQDAPIIVAEINKVAGYEIRDRKYLHWWTFLGYFSTIGEGTLSTIVGIREKRRTGRKMDKWEIDYYRENKRRIDFKERYTEEETKERARLNRLLNGEGGEDV